MHCLKIDASPTQLRKLRKGGRIRIKKGMGFNLIVNPSSYKLATRAFTKNKGVDIQLNNEELTANRNLSEDPNSVDVEGEEDVMSGNGIFSKIKSAVKKASPILKPLAREGLKYGGQKLMEKYDNKPLVKGALKFGLSQADKQLRGTGMAVNPQHGLTRKIGKANLDNNEELENMVSNSIKLKNHYPSQDELEEEPFAPFSRGAGFGGVGIVGHGGGMVGHGGYTPQALTSQPQYANFHMSFFMPPAYQKFSNSSSGNGLYAGRGLFV